MLLQSETAVPVLYFFDEKTFSLESGLLLDVKTYHQQNQIYCQNIYLHILILHLCLQLLCSAVVTGYGRQASEYHGI